jgi:hypothetical protein
MRPSADWNGQRYAVLANGAYAVREATRLVKVPALGYPTGLAKTMT